MHRVSLVTAAVVMAGCQSHAGSEAARRSTEMYGTSRPSFESGETVPDLSIAPELEEYLRYGLDESARLRAAFHRWRASVERADGAGVLPDPVFSYAHFIEDIETRTGPQRQRFSLQQTFPWFGVLPLQGDVARAEAEAMWWQVIAERFAVVREIKRAYFEYAFLAQAIRIDKESLRLLQQIEPVVQRRVQTGDPQADLLRLQLEIGRVENDLASKRGYRAALSARLRSAVNSRDTVLLPLPGAIESQPVEWQGQSVLMRALTENPALGVLRQRIAGERKRVELADAASGPNVTLGVDYFETGDARMPNTPGSGDDPIAVRVSMSLPIYRSKYEADVAAAQSREAAARAELHRMENKLRTEVELALFELEDAQRQVELYRDTLLPRARQAFELTESSYRAGKADLTALIDAERSLLTFEKSYWRAVSDYEMSLADLEAQSGGSLR